MIEGNKVIIRQLELGDEELLHKWRSDAKCNREVNYEGKNV